MIAISVFFWYIGIIRKVAASTPSVEKERKEMKRSISRKSIPVLLTTLFCIISILSMATVLHMHGSARAVNYAGIVRGATQRLAKQELNGTTNDALIQNLDNILLGLANGNQEMDLTALPDKNYQALIDTMRQDWEDIKAEIQVVRQGGDKSALFTLSESYFDLADQAVSAAEHYSENQVLTASIILICLNTCFIVLTFLFLLSGQRQRKAEIALKVAEQASRAKGDFLSRMSHEIRTPLNGIIGMTEIARLYSEDRDRREDCLNKVATSSRYLLSLINDILDMSQIESGKITLTRRPFAIQGIFDQIQGMFGQKAEEAGVDLKINCDNLTVPEVAGDELRLSQVLVNLVSNALKFTPTGGQVSLTGRQTAITDQDVTLEFVIADTGIGISPESQVRIFQPFEQEVTGQQYGGTGLGLAISNNFVNMMGGEISLQSKPGQGSQFTVRLTLPLATHETELHMAASSQEGSGDTADLTGTRVLLAEDNDINAEIATVILETNGAQVDRARDGQEVTAELMKAPPGTYSMILMDIQMPMMNGLEATQKIRASHHPDGRTIPIIGLSANAFSQDIEKALESGMNSYLSKPISVDKLLSAIQQAR